MPTRLPIRVALLVTMASAPAVAEAGEHGAADAVPIGLETELALHSAYVWRGLNVFADTDERGALDQNDQNAMVAPSLSYTLPGTDLTLGYWGAYQLNGENRAALVDAGVGAEQDVFAFWELELRPDVTLEVGATYYFYPFAEEEAAGIAFPHMIEPTVTATLSTGAADLGLTLAYFHAFNSELEAARHLYVSPAVSKELELTTAVGLELGAGFGYKIWTGDHGDDTSNTYDVLVAVSLPVSFRGPFSLTPGVSWAWTNLEERSFGDEQVLFGSVALGVSL